MFYEAIDGWYLWKFDALGSYAPKASQQERKTKKEDNILSFQRPSLNSHFKCIEGLSTNQERNRKCVVQASPMPSFEDEHHASGAKNILDSVKNFLEAFYMFCTPYAMIGRVSSNFFQLSVIILKWYG